MRVARGGDTSLWSDTTKLEFPDAAEKKRMFKEMRAKQVADRARAAGKAVGAGGTGERKDDGGTEGVARRLAVADASATNDAPSWQLAVSQLHDSIETMPPTVLDRLEAEYPTELQALRDVVEVVPAQTSALAAAVSRLYEGMQLAETVLAVGKAVANMVVDPDPLGKALDTLISSVVTMVSAVRGFLGSDDDSSDDDSTVDFDLTSPATLLEMGTWFADAVRELEALVTAGVAEASAIKDQVDECAALVTSIPGLPLAEIVSGATVLSVSECLQKIRAQIDESPVVSTAVAAVPALVDTLALFDDVIAVLEQARTNGGQVAFEALGFGLQVVKRVIALAVTFGDMSIGEIASSGVAFVSELTDLTTETVAPRVGRELGPLLEASDDVLAALPGIQEVLRGWTSEVDKDAAQDLYIAFNALRGALQNQAAAEASGDEQLLVTADGTTTSATVRQVAVLRAAINVKAILESNTTILLDAMPNNTLSIVVNALSPVVAGAGSVIIPAMAVVLEDVRTLITDVGTLIQIVADDGDRRQIDVIVSR